MMRRMALGNTGIEVPIVALGAASLGSIYHPVSQDRANAAVETALAVGMNHFDVAPYYGLTKAETALGIALRGVDRSRYTLATKIGRYGDQDWDFSAEATRRSVATSLARLGVSYVDVIQCHDIEYGDLGQLVAEALPTLRKLREEGVVRHIGITGYRLDVLERIALEQQVETVMAYCTYTLQDRRLALTARKLREGGIGVFNASPLGMGLLTNRGAPDWHPANDYVQERVREAARICRDAGSDISRLALQFAVATAAESGIATTVLGSDSAEHIRDAVAFATEPPDAELLARVTTVLAPVLNIGWDLLPGSGGKAGK